MTWTFNRCLRIGLATIVSVLVTFLLGYDLLQWEYWAITVPCIVAASMVTIMLALFVFPD